VLRIVLNMCAVYRLTEGYCSLFLINCDMGILDVFTVQVGFVYSMMFPVLMLRFASCGLNMSFCL
jgi:hypothetical protein